MNPLLLLCGSGMTLFLGAFIILFAAIGLEWVAGKWFARLRNLLGWLGAGLIFMATTPSPLWVEVIAGIAFLYWMGVINFAGLAKKTPRFGMSLATWMVAGGMLLLAGLEFPWTVSPELPPVRAKTVYVIGDSISSGLGGGDQPWPDLIAKEHNVRVVNLSRAGYGIADAAELAGKVSEPNSIVILEIGGNDIIGGSGAANAADFSRLLDSLIAQLEKKTKAVVMFELPLPPGKAAYGAAQRNCVAQNVFLIPKRIFVKPLMAGGSVDGLHLGPIGAQIMARETWQIIAPAVINADEQR